jgi:ketosteroid isomerase-like protein
VGDEPLETVKRMWIDYREQGVAVALVHLHPDVEFHAYEGGTFIGHEGVREFFSSYDGEVSFTASPYTFEPCGVGVIVAGHRRIHSPGSEDSQYMYFSHHVQDGLITRIAAWPDRDAATRDLTPSS